MGTQKTAQAATNVPAVTPNSERRIPSAVQARLVSPVVSELGERRATLASQERTTTVWDRVARDILADTAKMAALIEECAVIIAARPDEQPDSQVIKTLNAQAACLLCQKTLALHHAASDGNVQAEMLQTLRGHFATLMYWMPALPKMVSGVAVTSKDRDALAALKEIGRRAIRQDVATLASQDRDALTQARSRMTAKKLQPAQDRNTIEADTTAVVPSVN